MARLREQAQAITGGAQPPAAQLQAHAAPAHALTNQTMAAHAGIRQQLPAAAVGPAAALAVLTSGVRDGHSLAAMQPALSAAAADLSNISGLMTSAQLTQLRVAALAGLERMGANASAATHAGAPPPKKKNKGQAGEAGAVAATSEEDAMDGQAAVSCTHVALCACRMPLLTCSLCILGAGHRRE